MANESEKHNDGKSNWLWWTGGILLLLTYCNYSERDQRPEPANASTGLSATEMIAYRTCMGSSGAFSLSEYAKSEMCRRSALGLDRGAECRVEWDGRANPTVCE